MSLPLRHQGPLQYRRRSSCHTRAHRPLLWRHEFIRPSRRGVDAWAAAAAAREVWLQTRDKETFKAGLETGCMTAFVFGSSGDPTRTLLESWRGLAVFRALLLDPRGGLTDADSGEAVGEVVSVDGAAAARALEARVGRHGAMWRPAALQQAAAWRSGSEREEAEAEAEEAEEEEEEARAGTGAPGGRPGGGGGEWCLVLDARDWKVIPAENLVALAGGQQSDGPSSSDGPLRLMATAGSAEEARLMLEALETGTGGVLLRTDDPAQVRSLASYVTRRAAEESARPDQLLPLTAARVVAVRPLGMGDRACVDMAGLLQPGEGLLVGSFARCLALVHSECDESNYIASRPFRVNAGPVHAYVSTPGGRTRYLSELASGSEVLVADPAGRSRTALVGRVKIERRPLVLVELETPADPAQPPGSGSGGSLRHSLMLQNAETVKLVGPAPGHGLEPHNQQQQQQHCSLPMSRTGLAAEGEPGPQSGAERPWRALPVSSLRPGDEVWVVMQAAARHTGIAIQEFIVEK